MQSHNKNESFVLDCMANGGTGERNLADWLPVLDLT